VSVISSSSRKTITLGVATEFVRGDIYFRGELRARALVAAVPVEIAYNFFLARVIAGITGGAVR
jgi:ABC-type glycerol-3-phosphate transport system permease component